MSTGYESPPGVHSKLTKNGSGFDLWRTNGTRLHFNTSGVLTTIIDKNGNHLHFEYSASALTTIRDDSGRRLNLTYNSAGRITEVVDPLGRTIDYRYENGTLVEVVDPMGNATRYTYYDDHKLKAHVDRTNTATIFSYYAGTGPDRVKEIRSARYSSGIYLSPVSMYTLNYSDGGDEVTVTTEAGERTRIRLNDRGNPVLVNATMGATTRMAWDADMNIVNRTDPNGNTYRYEYDAFGNLLNVTDPFGNSTQFGYRNVDTATRYISLLVNKTDPKGRTTTFAYDSRGNLINVTDPAGHSRKFSYTEHGFLNATIEHRDGETIRNTFTYDSQGNRRTWTDPTGAVTSYRYDAAGRLVNVTDPTGATTRFVYDANDRIRKRIDPLGHETVYKYDAAGNLIDITDANGNEVTDRGGSYTVQTDGDRWSVTDTRTNKTVFFDARGRVVAVENALGGMTNYSYDAAGNLVTVTDANGNVTKYTYDAKNRLVRVTGPSGPPINYSYDAVGNLLSVEQGAQRVLYGYDSLDRVVNVTVDFGRFTKTIQYEYDSTDNRVKMIGPGGNATSYEYDKAGLVTNVTGPSGRTFSYAYDAAGRVTSKTFPNDVTTNYTYDAAGQLVNLTTTNGSEVIAGFSYTYDGVGNVLSVTNATGETTSYSYDDRDRLRSVKAPSGRITNYSYDDVGNRLTKEQAGDVTNYSYDAAGRLQTAGNVSYAYDANGNLRSRTGTNGTTQFGYDFTGRLVSAELPDGRQIEYGYSPTGQRIRKTSNGETTYYLRDAEDVLMEFDANGSVTARYVHGPKVDEPLAQVREGATHYYHLDNVGSVRALTDETGQVAATYEYGPFGSITEQTGNVDNPYRFTGRTFEEELGLYFYRERYYDPTVGRFLSEDPMGTAPTKPNPYAYVRNNPTSRVDPFGRIGMKDIWGGMKTAASYTMTGLKHASPMYHGYKLLSSSTYRETLRELPGEIGRVTEGYWENIATFYRKGGICDVLEGEWEWRPASQVPGGRTSQAILAGTLLAELAVVGGGTASTAAPAMRGAGTRVLGSYLGNPTVRTWVNRIGGAAAGSVITDLSGVRFPTGVGPSGPSVKSLITGLTKQGLKQGGDFLTGLAKSTVDRLCGDESDPEEYVYGEVDKPVTISRPGTYVQTRDIGGEPEGIVINKSDVTYNGNGHRIAGGSTAAETPDPAGVYVRKDDTTEITGVTVKNVVVSNLSRPNIFGGWGVRFLNASGGSIQNVRSTKNEVGIRVSGRNNEVVDNVVKSNTFAGIRGSGEANSYINNTVTGNNDETSGNINGAMELGGWNTIVRNNRITNNRNRGIVVNGIFAHSYSDVVLEDVTVTANHVANNSNTGIEATGRGHMITENTLENNFNGVAIIDTGISDGGQHTISRNTIEGSTEDGISILFSDDNQIADNDLSDNGDGIHGAALNSNSIVTNDVAGGIELTRSHNVDNVIKDNTVGWGGITVRQNVAGDVTSRGNLIASNDVSGGSIRVDDANDNRIRDNTVSDGRGISIGGDDNDVRSNTISGSASTPSNCCPDGFSIAGKNNTVMDNTAADTRGTGFLASGFGRANNTFLNNTASRNAESGFSISGDGNTVQNNNARSNGIHGFSINDGDNVVADNVAFNNSNAGIRLEWGTSNATVSGNSLRSNSRGIVLIQATQNSIVDNTVRNNTEWSFRSESDSTDNVVEGLTIDTGTTLSFTHTNIALEPAESRPTPPSGYRDIDTHLTVVSTAKSWHLRPWVNLTLHYADGDVSEADESTLRLWRYDGTAWSKLPNSTVNTTGNVVSADLTTFSVIAPLVELTDTTSPRITDAIASDATDSDGQVTDGDVIEVSANVTDTATGVDTVTANASAFGAGVVELTDSDGDGRYTATVTVDAGGDTDDGSHPIPIGATDTAGNTNRTATNTLVFDTTSPVITDPEATDHTDGDGTVGDGEEIAIAATVSDATTSVGSVTANASAFGAGVVELTDSDGDGRYTATVTVDASRAAREGTHGITIEGVDATNNTARVATDELTLATTGSTVTETDSSPTTTGTAPPVTTTGGATRTSPPTTGTVPPVTTTGDSTRTSLPTSIPGPRTSPAETDSSSNPLPGFGFGITLLAFLLGVLLLQWTSALHRRET